VLSLKALEEFVKLCPNKIDRYTSENYPIWYIIRDSLLLIPSTKNWQERRRTATKLIGINNISAYIPMMIKSCDDILNINATDMEERKRITTPEGDLNLTVLIKRMSFKIICTILFGRDIHNFDKKLDFVN